MKKILIFCIIFEGLSCFSVHAYYYEPVRAEIEVEITLGGTVIIIPNSNCPIPEKTEIHLQNGEIGKFDINFTKVGIYDYTVRTIPDERHLNFDKTVYNIKIYVTDEDGNLAVTFVASKSEDKYGSNHLVFVNTVPETEKTVSTPKSGDDSTTETYFFAMLVSVGLLIFSVIDTKKNIK